MTYTAIRKISARERGALETKEFLGEDAYNRWRAHHDELLSERKKRHGKPDDAERMLIDLNRSFIEFYDSVLFHSPFLALGDKCVCARCSKALRKEAK